MSLLAIIRNEWRNLFRTRQALVLLLMLLLLSSFAIWQAFSSFEKYSHAREKAVKYMREKFVGQGEVNPHGAAHYGHFVYKPLNTLSILDEGVNAFTGVSLRLEGHLQNEAMFSPSQASSSLVRFGSLTLSLILQVLLPLFVLFVCHNAVSRERENGNLALAVSQGGSMRSLVWGKTLAFALVWVGFLLLVILILWAVTASGSVELSFPRMAVIGGLYGAYYFIITAFAVYISAFSKSSRSALIGLLFAWLICTVLLPKAAANIGENIDPMMSRIELEKSIAEDNRDGINGHDPGSERTKRFKDSLLKVYKVDSLKKLPVNLDGLTMQADEEYHNVVYDKHFGRVQRLIRTQNQVAAISAWINPFAAVQNISSSVSGTDVYHHFDFTDSAEVYRRKIIKLMNEEQAYGGSKTGDWDWTVGVDFWDKIDDFDYCQPAVKWSLSHNKTELVALVTWLLAVVFLIHFTTNRISILK